MHEQHLPRTEERRWKSQKKFHLRELKPPPTNLGEIGALAGLTGSHKRFWRHKFIAVRN